MLAQDLLLADPVTDSILRFDGETGAALGEFVPSSSGGLVDPLDPTFGPDGNLYVFSTAAGAKQILQYDGSSGEFLDAFVDGVTGLTTFVPPDGAPADLAVTNLHVSVGVVQGNDLSITDTV